MNIPWSELSGLEQYVFTVLTFWITTHNQVEFLTKHPDLSTPTLDALQRGGGQVYQKYSGRYRSIQTDGFNKPE